MNYFYDHNLSYMKRLYWIFLVFPLFFSCKDEGNPPPPPPPADEFIRGADLSFLPEIETYQVNFTDTAGHVKDVLAILKEAGCNTVRLRLWHTPVNEHSSLAEVADFSQRVKAAGLRVYLTVHFSDTWADPGHQATPAAWEDLTLSVLRDSVYNYISRVVTLIEPDYISLGNEINAGMLWETGRIDNGDNFFQLLGQAIQATRQFSPASKIIIHFAGLNGADGFFSRIKSFNLSYDIIGISYYPYWHGKNLNTLTSTISSLVNSYGKPVLIAETAYPFTLEWNDWTHNSIGLEEQLMPEYPATPAGQLAFMTEIRTILTTVKSGAGFCYWGGEWIAFRGPQAEDGSSWENQALFDFSNQALPVIRVFKK